jgi:signal transduction histidine kinase
MVPVGCHSAIRARLMARLRIKQKSAAKPARRTEAAVLAVFAHDIRTALTGILALGELLASSNLGERERRWAAGIKGSAEHLAALTTLVIDAAKADSGALTLQQEVFRPRRLIEALGEALTARTDAKTCPNFWSAIRCGCAPRWKTSSTMR